MGGKVQYRGSRLLLILILAGLTLPLLVPASIRAGLSETSPAEFEIIANPQTVDEVAIRGTTARSSTAGNDIPIGVVGRSTGSALGTDSEVAAVGADAEGDALGTGSSVFAIHATVAGNAAGSNSEVSAMRASASGNASGAETEIVGIRAVASGTATGQNTDVSGIVAIARTTAGIAVGVRARSQSPDGIGVRGQASATSGNTMGVFGHASSPDGAGVVGRGEATSGLARGVVGESLSSSGIGIHGISPGLAGMFDGRVQINCSTPPCLKINTNSVDDLAENMPVVSRVVPGDVVVLAEGRGGYGVAPASHPYDTRVAGIVSAHPPVVLQNNQQGQAAPVAMVGIVRAKATAANGAIRFGDLLTTSRIPGHLMRCPTAVKCVGAVVGKALEPLANGEKQILVMLWRQ